MATAFWIDGPADSSGFYNGKTVIEALPGTCRVEPEPVRVAWGEMVYNPGEGGSIGATQTLEPELSRSILNDVEFPVLIIAPSTMGYPDARGLATQVADTDGFTIFQGVEDEAMAVDQANFHMQSLRLSDSQRRFGVQLRTNDDLREEAHIIKVGKEPNTALVFAFEDEHGDVISKVVAHTGPHLFWNTKSGDSDAFSLGVPEADVPGLWYLGPSQVTHSGPDEQGFAVDVRLTGELQAIANHQEASTIFGLSEGEVLTLMREALEENAPSVTGPEQSQFAPSM
ncbi:hypothetical protein [Thalassospira xiamenensis]|uniref:Uncharacterized protein n=1 Tax=Thalassospira xiamenensis TaxID=220697 RepID=A0A285TVP5_9PROT|nr:hypothetical protein [Thalassospira xiamenensis]SOC26166.1 hypothetical protein SAMN05428964_10571 [Thalassospira xiamenensis]